MSNLDKVIGKRICEARTRAGLSQREVGESLGLTAVGFGDIERGKNQASIEYLFALSRILHTPIEAFLGLGMGLDTDKERVLLHLFRSLPDDSERDRALSMFKAFAGKGD